MLVLENKRKHLLIREAIKEDCLPIAKNMRESDIREVWAASKSGPLEAVRNGFLRSRLCWTGTLGDIPIWIGGVVSLGEAGGVGCPWLLGTDKIMQCPIQFLKSTKRYVDHIASQYDLIYNYVDARNTENIKWLQFVGFSIGKAVPYGVLGLPFHKFEMRGCG